MRHALSPQPYRRTSEYPSAVPPVAFSTIHSAAPSVGAWAGHCYRRILTWVILGVMIGGLVAGASREAAAEESPESPEVKTVTLVIDYGDGAQKRISDVPWKPAMTVLDVMQIAKQHPHGIDFRHRGTGKIAFLFQIDDLENESAGGKNWIFYVDQTRGTSSFAVAEVPAESTVLWSFEEYE